MGHTVNAAWALTKGAIAGAAAIALTVSAVPAVSAQSTDTPSSADSVGHPAVLDPASVEGSLGEFADNGVLGSVPNPGGPIGSLLGLPSGSVAGSSYLTMFFPLGSVLAGADTVGSGEFPGPGSVSGSVSGRPLNQRDPDINETRVLDVQPLYSQAERTANPEFERAEVWTVTSASMEREVRVEVYRAPQGAQGPIIYFLDGVGSNSPSGWSGGMGFRDPAMRARPNTVVAPTGAPSSMFADWNSDDPVLGPNMWETFLTKELPPLLESDTAPGLADVHNDRYGTLGVSMGGGPAVHLVNQHPDMFGAAAGISSCYSSTDPIGYQYHRLTVDAEGGDATNMWGPRGSAEWLRHDTKSDPSGLTGKRVYLSAATGFIGSTDLSNFGSNETLLLNGQLLERGSYECTVAFERALDEAGVEHHADYDAFGIHNWPVFVPRMTTAMDYIMAEEALGPFTYPEPSAGGDAAGSGSAGSLGSVGS